MKMYQVDAFTDQLFAGNPAAVIITKQWLDVEIMQNIAIENNLSETSFARKIDEQVYEIRWFSPIKEVQFCGYGTLATSFIIFQENPQIKSITFQVKQMGEFYIQKQENGFIAMNFPVQIPEKIHNIPQELEEERWSHMFEQLKAYL
ncbi:PhzF family phenazine biosynthesis protein [Acinetobacter seifertii]|uniref:PhzF family phenazine biosynthesis protein n=1 Tax=Acinetobacter seifertii TaxID=1530123 RepID=UPI0032B45B7E